MQTTEKYRIAFVQFSLIILTFSIKTKSEDFIGGKQTKMYHVYFSFFTGWVLYSGTANVNYQITVFRLGISKKIVISFQ